MLYGRAGSSSWALLKSTGDFSALFEPVDRKWKLYRRKGSLSPANLAEFHIPQHPVEHDAHALAEHRDKKPSVRESDRKIAAAAIMRRRAWW